MLRGAVMATAELQARADAALTNEVIAHLEAQLVAARRLLQVVLEQGVGDPRPRRQARRGADRRAPAELHHRRQLETERIALLERAGARLGVAGASVSMAMLETLMDPESALLAGARSAELRGLLEVVQREHHVNRALMSQEWRSSITFSSWPGIAGDESYNAGGDRLATTAAQTTGHRVFDLEV